jgi:hypothetical protein
MEHHFHVSLTDEQLEAAKVASAARGVNLGPVGSLSRDGVTLNYTIEKDDAGANDVSVDLIYWPFYVDSAAIEKLITDFLTAPPVEPAAAAPPAEPAPKTTKAETTHETTVAPHLVEQESARHHNRK